MELMGRKRIKFQLQDVRHRLKERHPDIQISNSSSDTDTEGDDHLQQLEDTTRRPGTHTPRRMHSDPITEPKINDFGLEPARRRSQRRCSKPHRLRSNEWQLSSQPYVITVQPEDVIYI